MDELTALGSLARAMGVYTDYIDGLGRPVSVGPDTLVRTCASLGAEIETDRPVAEILMSGGEARGVGGTFLPQFHDGAAQGIPAAPRTEPDRSGVVSLQHRDDMSDALVVELLCGGLHAVPVDAALRDAAQKIGRCAAQHQEAGADRSTIGEHAQDRKEIGSALDLVEDHEPAQRLEHQVGGFHAGPDFDLGLGKSVQRGDANAVFIGGQVPENERAVEAGPGRAPGFTG